MKDKIKQNLPIGIIMLVGLFLYGYNIWQVGYANYYYSAGVYSMGQNLHAFFFNSLDSIGFVTIDKPPLGFWIQVLFTKVFGFSGWSVILPEILAGVTSIYLLYNIVQKRFSKGAGLAAAAVLAVTPIFAAVSRNNTIDGILILLMILAVNEAIKATEKSSLKHLIFAGIFIGLGFNVKMLQAYMIVPAVYLTYLIFSKKKIFKRIAHCTVSFIILLVISLSWVVIVDGINPDNRPYVGSSDTNSALELAIGYNGINRIFGGQSSITQYLRNIANDESQEYNTADIQNNNQNRPPIQNQNNQDRPALDSNQNIRPQQNNGLRPSSPNGGNASDGGNNYGNNGRGKGNEAGNASLFRMFNDENAGQIAWFVLPSIACVLFMIYLIVKRKLIANSKNITSLLFAIAFISMITYFSFSSGLAHRYYFATMAPYIAGLVGILFYYLIKEKNFTLPLVFGLTAASQIYIQNLYGNWLGILVIVMLGLFILILIVMIIGINAKFKSKWFVLMLCSLLILPTIWTATPILYGENSKLPITGPELIDERNGNEPENDYSGLIRYLEENRDDADYLVMTPSSMNFGAEILLGSGEPVMALGGFNGGDQIVDLDEFIQMIEDNEVKYALINANQNNGSNSRIFNWISNNCHIINPTEYGGRTINGTLYDLTSYK